MVPRVRETDPFRFRARLFIGAGVSVAYSIATPPGADRVRGADGGVTVSTGYADGEAARRGCSWPRYQAAQPITGNQNYALAA
jgi:hypothetical protein